MLLAFSMFGGAGGGGADTLYEEATSRGQRTDSLRRQTNNTADQSQLASSSHILGSSRQVPWWLRQNRKRLNEIAEAGTSSGHLSRVPSNTSHVNNDIKKSRQTTPSESPATHTMFLPTHGSPFRLAQTSPSPATNVRNFVQNVYNAGRDAVGSGTGHRQGPIHLQTHLSRKDKALWNWVNVDDLDEFLQEVYTFYIKKGIWSIALAGFLDLL